MEHRCSEVTAPGERAVPIPRFSSIVLFSHGIVSFLNQVFHPAAGQSVQFSHCSRRFYRARADHGLHDAAPVQMKIDFFQHNSSILAAGIFFFCCIEILQAFTGNRFELDEEVLVRAEQKYGANARERLLAWQDLINGSGGLTEREKLEKANGFFNTFDFVSDASHWGVDDYWATPVEFIASSGGDCEDFALAKYFTLKSMGVTEKKLNLTYVKALSLNQAHMVLTYYATPDAEPLVLDNLVRDIRPASGRTDLLPVYSFNGSGLWIAKQRGRGRLVGDSDRLQRWRELLGRMPQGLN